MPFKLYSIILILLITLTGCGDNSTPSDEEEFYEEIVESETTADNSSTPIDDNVEQSFTIIYHQDDGFHAFNRKIEVFGIPLYASPRVEDIKLTHAANVLAQYLDNDEDGTVDNPKVVASMHHNNAFMVMWKELSDLDSIEPEYFDGGQDLGNDETRPIWHTNGHRGAFDTTIEEVWHLVTRTGYAETYPNVFGEHQGSTLTDAMDTARGGQFMTVPEEYPQEAWYTYYDTTCDYNCMATEYIYWSMTSILGANTNRFDEIQEEWDLYTKNLVQTVDTSVYNLLTNPEYSFPTILPDGSYQK
ncbi:MAG: hypothetical protein K0U38_07555 [Epsilonproteobacteria bacterium]|nr:hypothetical protein [Campylobacterota bacterium]